MIIFEKRKNTWAMRVRSAESGLITIGGFETKEIAKAAEVEFKAAEHAKAAKALEIKLEIKANELAAKYNRFLEFCLTYKDITDIRLGLDIDINTAQNTMKSLLNRGYMASFTARKGDIRKYYTYKTIRLMTFEDAMTIVLPRKYKPRPVEETLAGARVVKFDNGKYNQLYQAQRKLDRANMKSPKNSVSGATMSNSVW